MVSGHGRWRLLTIKNELTLNLGAAICVAFIGLYNLGMLACFVLGFHAHHYLSMIVGLGIQAIVNAIIYAIIVTNRERMYREAAKEELEQQEQKDPVVGFVMEDNDEV